MNTTAEVSSPSVDEDKLRQQVVPHAQKIDPSFNLDKATPPNAARSEDDSDLVANVEHALKVGRSKITGESIWARIGKALIGSKIWHRRKAQQANVSIKHDPSQMDLGE
ncbi:MAG: hypothetical protein G01um10147_960 [Microgenomates group bacterium Gr01-1014_7]|nr:MAG: hypothetical protein G01um10147_960 [Microgenomates group bacterium Gr01-1014_7]